MNCLSHEKARLLVETVRGDRLEALYVVAVTAGLRHGELLGLKREDNDFEAKCFSVRRTLSAAKEGPTFTTPTSAESRRRMTLTESVVEALKGHRERQSEEKVIVGAKWRDQDLVFCLVVGAPEPPQPPQSLLQAPPRARRAPRRPLPRPQAHGCHLAPQKGHLSENSPGTPGSRHRLHYPGYLLPCAARHGPRGRSGYGGPLLLAD
jgi:integrase